MITILKELKEQGYLLILASNLEPDVFEYNLKKCPEFLDFFDFHFLSTVENSPAENTEYITKPNQQYFVDLRKKVNEYVSDDVEIIFIDDRQENIEAANKSNLTIRGFLPQEFELEFQRYPSKKLC